MDAGYCINRRTGIAGACLPRSSTCLAWHPPGSAAGVTCCSSRHVAPAPWGPTAAVLRPCGPGLLRRHRRHQLCPPPRASSAPSSLATGTVVRMAGMEDIRWGSALSRNPDLEEAMEEAVGRIQASIGQDAQPDVALVFASSLHGADFDMVVPMLRQRLPSLKTVFGCSGYGVVGGSDQGPVEVEGEHAFSLTLGQLPGTTVRVLHTLRSSIPGEDASPEDWAQFVGVPHDSPKPTSFIIFADPRFAQVRDIVAGLDYAFPDAPKIGSILSSGTRSKSRAMWAWSQHGPAGGAAAGRQAVGTTSLSKRKGGPPGSGLRGQRGRGSSGGALFSTQESAMASVVLAVMKKEPLDGSPVAPTALPPGSQQSTPGSSGSSSSSSREAQDPPDVVVLSEGSKGSTSGAASSSGSSADPRQPGAASLGEGGRGRAKSTNLLGSMIQNILGSKLGSSSSSSNSSAETASGSGSGAAAQGSSGLNLSLSSLAANSKQNMLQGLKDMKESLLTAAGVTEGEGPGAGRPSAGAAAGAGAPLLVPDVPSNGMYLYGAVVLALQGDVQLDVLTSTGYRAPSPRIWRIVDVSDGRHIESLMPEELAVELSSKGGLNRSSPPRGRVISRGLVSEDDSDDEEDGDEEGGAEVQALSAVVDVLDCLTSQEEGLETVMDRWKEVMDTAVVAVAADNSKPADELGPNDWELLPLEAILDSYGVLVVGDPPVVGGGVDLRRGNRIRIMIRDPQGVRSDLQSCLLSYKRRDLAAMMNGRQLPPTFGGLLFTDVDRGLDCYQEPHYESTTAHAYVPAPISGLFGGAQIGPLQSAGSGTAILEYAAVVGVLRAATDRSNAAIKQGAQQRRQGAQRAAEELAAEQQQQQEQERGRDQPEAK